MSRFLCVGDLHLDKGGRYGRVPGERLAEQETVWARALELAREHQVDAVLFAGDAFEKRHPSTDAMLAFERPLVQHRHEGGNPVIAIPGNHDRSGVSDFCALDVFNEAGLIELHSRPTVASELALLPWAPVSRIVAAHDGGDRDDINTVAAELLLETARGLRSQIDGPAILLTHFSIGGAVTPDGADVGLFREPVLSLGDLEAIGFDAVIAGHIHAPQPLGTLAPDDELMPIFYVGSPLPLDFGEAKCNHGVWLLDQGTRSWATTFLPIESRPFLTLDVDITGETETTGLAYVDIGLAADGQDTRGAFVKVRYRATEEQARRVDHEAIREGLTTLGAHNMWIEPTIVRELRARVAGLDESITDLAALGMWLASQSINGSKATRLAELSADYIQEIS